MKVKCEICGLEMKGIVNGSHLKRKHNITISEYIEKFPLSSTGSYYLKNKTFKCEICKESMSNHSSIKMKHLKLHGISNIHEYNLEYIKPPICECGCGNFTNYSYSTADYNRFVEGHCEVWNRGLTKETSNIVANMKSGGWNRGLTKETDKAVARISKNLKKNWKDNPNRKDAMLLNMKKTMLNRYGVENPNDYPQFWAKYKKYTLPSGKVVKVQGYEPLGIDFLLESYKENDIITNRKELPKFEYEVNGIKKKYTPDMYVVSVNTIFEIKSTWTYKIFKHKDEKIKSVLNAGYNYCITVFDGNGYKTKIEKYER